jgi:hypothetical protein
MKFLKNFEIWIIWFVYLWVGNCDFCWVTSVSVRLDLFGLGRARPWWSQPLAVPALGWPRSCHGQLMAVSTWPGQAVTGPDCSKACSWSGQALARPERSQSSAWPWQPVDVPDRSRDSPIPGQPIAGPGLGRARPKPSQSLSAPALGMASPWPG